MQKIVTYGTALYFILTAILVIFLTISQGRPAHVLWFCYTGLLIMSIGILMKKGWLIASQLNLIAIPLLVWKIDYFYHLVTGVSLFGAIDYFFVGEEFITQLIVIQHAITLPLSLYMLYFIKIEHKKGWILSILQAILIFILIRIFTTPEYNVNCAYRFCSPLIQIPELMYPFIWIIVLSGTAIGINAVLVRLFGANIFKPTRLSKKQMNKKGVSPLIATLLLVVFAISVGAGVMSWASSISAAIPPVTCDRVKINVDHTRGNICVSDSAISIILENGPKRISGLRISYIANHSNFIDYLNPIEEGVLRNIQIYYNLASQGAPNEIHILPFIDTERGRLYCTEQSETITGVISCL
jgi:flagellin-like protein